MAKTVVGLFKNSTQAQSAIRDLLEAGIDRARIGMVASHSGASDETSKTEDKEGKVATVVAGVGTAAIGGLGLAMALAPLAIPGVGLIIAAGALAAGLTGAGVARSLPKVLHKLGVPEEHGHAYAEGVRRGGTLVTVEALNDNEVQQSVALMKKHGAVDIEKRAEEWRQAGWSGRQEEGPDRAAAEPAAPFMADEADEVVVGVIEVAPGALFVFEAEPAEAWQGEERRRGRQQYSGAERRMSV